MSYTSSAPFFVFPRTSQRLGGSSPGDFWAVRFHEEQARLTNCDTELVQSPFGAPALKFSFRAIHAPRKTLHVTRYTVFAYRVNLFLRKHAHWNTRAGKIDYESLGKLNDLTSFRLSI